ncbi:DUF4097 domain-containing protein [Mycobacterium sp. MYCO198283]|uniref:DUF4097 family beta strand repeat-containing protein n=1 Tax=Mycobacterium sp. MYCO198283 TaxID=2883505 RepID=UPI001E2BD6B0|nr:DUF4097 family beta strand repeat-containing protein [Mycobacterium sp. MYCO198283]MCG5430712.1 DUF4097 domain-containing protein [Mycobacterium sp. MYCO198283]
MTAATPPPSVSPGTRVAVRVALVVVASLTLLATVGTLAVGAVGIGTARVLTDSQPLPAAMRSLVIDGGDTGVRIQIHTDEKAREPRVELTALSFRGADRRLQVTTEGDRVRLQAAGDDRGDGFGGGWPGWGPAELDVTLPPATARRLAVDTTQRNGMLRVDGALDALTARLDNGAVVLRGSATRVDVAVRNGSVRTRADYAVQQSFTATAGNGDVEARFAADGPDTVDAGSRNGDVALQLSGPGPFLVRTQARNGDTEVTVPETSDPARAATTVDAHTENGDVTVTGSR